MKSYNEWQQEFLNDPEYIDFEKFLIDRLNATGPNASTMTDEERVKFFEATLSPLIRYGFSEALDRVHEFIVERLNDNITFVPLADVLDKLLELQKAKHQVNYKKLMAERENNVIDDQYPDVGNQARSHNEEDFNNDKKLFK